MDRSASTELDIVSFATPILINMANRPRRLADSLTELSIAAGRAISVEDVHLIRPATFDDPGGFASSGFRSNLDAHLRAARWARETEQERVFVMEDDLAFGAGWQTHGPGLLAALAAQRWHLASLGYLDVWGQAPSLGSAVSAGGDGDGRGRWVRFSGQVNGAHAYLLHRSAHDRWMDHLTMVASGVPGDDLRGPMPSDGAINTFAWVNPDVVRLLAVPNMVGTRPTRSDITPSMIDRLPLVGTVVEELRRLRRRRYGAKVTNF